ncbi:MAG: tetratricopeptide repeat protein [Nitrospirales bacterium]|nr:tetratricopeptide repeat protein [Nitrospirales bacterium]
MNRAQRRQQEQHQRSQKDTGNALNLRVVLNESVAHLQGGRFAQAESGFLHILEEMPRHADSLHFLGIIAYRRGALPKARDFIEQAIQVDGTKPHYYFNQGLVLHANGQLAAAVEAYKQAASLKTDYYEAYANLGNVYRDAVNLPKAVEAYQQSIASKPGYADGYNNLGVAYKEQKNLDQAVEAFQQALAINPNHAEAHYNIGTVLHEQEKQDGAIRAFEQALRLKPHYANAHHHLGLSYLWKGHIEAAVSALRHSADCSQNHGKSFSLQSVYKSRVKHDAEQVQYLMAHGLLGKEHAGYCEALQLLQTRALETDSDSVRMVISREECEAIAPSFNRILHYANCPLLSQEAVNPTLDVVEIQKRYNQQQPEIMFVDDLLTEEALASLRRFCLESTIWKKDYENGYIGALLGEGFSSPLLLQISEELRVRFPKIFRRHRLVQSWAFKQDSQRRGLNIHADAAAVNVNFWVTPDEANQDPTSGGLVVWDKEAPHDWDFNEYNNTQYKPKIFEFLEAHGAQTVRVPYRQNRAVIFNSDLFHETDYCVFHDNYESRRINITMLYGHRLKA